MGKYIDPRLVLIHEGNKNSGRYPRGSGDRPYQHENASFGIRKYVNEDGTLTEAGKARWELDKKRNAQKKKDQRAENENALKDPHRWVKEDLDSYQQSIQGASNMVRSVQEYEQKKLAKRKPVRKKKLDLSTMTDQDLNAEINRYLLEQRYQDIFNPKEPPPVSKGKEWLLKTLEVTGSVLAVGASAVGIAKTMHDLKKG